MSPKAVKLPESPPCAKCGHRLLRGEVVEVVIVGVFTALGRFDTWNRRQQHHVECPKEKV